VEVTGGIYVSAIVRMTGRVAFRDCHLAGGVHLQPESLSGQPARIIARLDCAISGIKRVRGPGTVLLSDAGCVPAEWGAGEPGHAVDDFEFPENVTRI
jgi:hypothetical protein